MKIVSSRLIPLQWLAVVLPLVLAAGCSRNQTAARGSGGPVVPVQVAVAVQQDVPRRIESIGTVQALRTVSVKSQVDGVIAQVNFKEGEDLKAGDLLVTLDRRPFENSLRSARAELANARAQADQAQADLDRYHRLDQQAAVSKEEYVQWQTKAETTKAMVQAREASVANAELQLSYTEIRAPIAGRTGQRLLHEGALVKANDNNFTIVTINQLTPVAVTYAVPEHTLDEIRSALAAGRATVSVTDRSSGLTRENGKLEFVDNTVDPATGMITLKAVFPNEDNALWPGRFVYAVTQVGTDPGAIVVPSRAVQNSQNGSTIYVLKDDRTVELRTVKVMRTAGDNTLLDGGVRAGETVVTDGQLRLLPGMKAEPRQLSGAPVVDGSAGEKPKKS
ncbi:MAG TPA: efflux RND transporter periplasmic adaptor subunit [Candidatus Didemnitutus sp.]|nr:efflux RND transporter periplasmic adaptor subunit [Candidatus Didemnitutus sp.]